MRLYSVILLFLTGCSSIYIPSTPNIPLISKESETDLNIGANTNSILVNGSYAISDNLAAIGEFAVSYGNFSNISDLGDIMPSDDILFAFNGGGYNNWNTELGIGKFISLSHYSIFEFYSGLGYGNSNAYNHEKNNYGLIFLQSNIGMKRKKIEIGGSLKISGAYFNYQYERKPNLYEDIDIPICSIQLGGILRTGSDNLKFWFSPSSNGSFLLKSQDYTEIGGGFNDGKFYTAINISIGINLSF